ncbi:MAG: FKBP-type peptidyl-prolyl cis-trans isomerase [Gemmatimonadota bacterium]|nr:FKBP-type peptidyl-prolyl cis-trans isomerase [Gemmatimonadota bacterium]
MQAQLLRGRASVLAALVLVAACSAESAGSRATAALETDDQKASYGIGSNMAQNLVPMADRIDMDALVRGFEDALAEAEPAVPMEELHPLLQAFQQDLFDATQRAQAAKAETGRAEADAFLTENGAREGVMTTESGLQYEILEQGSGPSPSADDRVTIHYRGTLLDGTVFDSSYDRDKTATFSLQGVIAGFSEGLQMMQVGSKYKLYIPPELGYGAQGSGPIPPNSALIFELELLSIE